MTTSPENKERNNNIPVCLSLRNLKKRLMGMIQVLKMMVYVREEKAAVGGRNGCVGEVYRLL